MTEIKRLRDIAMQAMDIKLVEKTQQAEKLRRVDRRLRKLTHLSRHSLKTRAPKSQTKVNPEYQQ